VLTIDRMTRGAASAVMVVALAACAPPASDGAATAGPEAPPPARLGAASFAPSASGPDVLMQRNDFTRTGQNNSETTLTLANVKPATFGRLFTLPVDGVVYAQPLYKHGVTFNGFAHDVVFVATEHDSVYAFDANSGALLWSTSYINPPAITPQPYADTGDGPPTTSNPFPALYPEVGITSTPTIDPATGTMYVVAKTKENGVTRFRLHAVDITTGQDKVPNVVLAPSVPGSGDGNVGGIITLDAAKHQQRPGLVLLSGVVYVAFGSSGDNFQWHGWVAGYNAANLSLVSVWNTTPAGGAGAIWASGAAPAVDGSGKLYFSTGNGSFDGATCFGCSVVKLSTASGLSLADFFAPFNQSMLTSADNDFGSSGVVLLPDVAGTPAHPHLAAAAGKGGQLYLLDRDNLGGFSPSTSNPDAQIVQELFNAIGDHTLDNFANPMPTAENSYSTPAYWRDAAGHDHLYWVGAGDNLKMFDLTNGVLSSSVFTRSPETYEFPGASPAISSNGTANGIVWAVQNAPGGAILHAYDATNPAVELYSSDQAANNRDALGIGAKFVVPTITTGKVFVGTRSALVVFGLLGPAVPVPALPGPAVWLCGLLLAACGLGAIASLRRSYHSAGSARVNQVSSHQTRSGMK